MLISEYTQRLLLSVLYVYMLLCYPLSSSVSNNASLTTKLTVYIESTFNIAGCALLDICFIVDSSGSIRDNNKPGQTDNWQLILNFVNSVIDRIEVGSRQSRVGLVKFSTDAIRMFRLDEYDNRLDLQRVVRRQQYIGGRTNTADGLRITRELCFGSANGDRPEAPNVAILVTDGVPTEPTPDNYARQRAEEEGNRLKNSGVKVYTIGVTNAIDEALLKQLSSPPQKADENYFTSTDFESLGDILNSLVSSACAQSTIRPFPTDQRKYRVHLKRWFICLFGIYY